MSTLAQSFAEARGGDSDDEIALWSMLATGGGGQVQAAREKLFARYAAFARRVARRIQRQRDAGDLDKADIDQLAYIGLMEALDRYDPVRGTPFTGFAAARIRGAVIDGIIKMNDMREQMAWRHRMRRERMASFDLDGATLESADDALAALTEIALGLAVGFMLEGTTLYQAGEDSKKPSAYESVAWQDMQGRLKAGLENLPDRERHVITHHYIGGVAFEQLARLLGVSKGRISQIHRAALQRLRKFMCNNGYFRLEE